MLRSMTGFGSAAAETDDYSLRFEVRSVNHRHLAVKMRIPNELAFAEAELERLVRRKLDRGSVTVHLHYLRAARAQVLRVNVEAAERYRTQLEELCTTLGLPQGFSPDAYLTLPGVLQAADSTPASESGLGSRLSKLLGTALTALVQMREVEGAALAEDLAHNAALLGKLVVRIEKRMPTVVRAHQKSLAKRVEELLGRRASLSEADLAREIALLADRLDVGEEVTRLRSHLDQLGVLLAGKGPVGRKLDFLVQEIVREINTIGSKCSDAKVAHWVVDSKACAERLREQVQNIE